MQCEHCIFSCTERGEDMSIDIFCRALDAGQGSNNVCDIGGGEPTLHPMFWDMIEMAIQANYRTVWVSTNGKNVQDAIKLSEMARNGVLACQLSLSKYHEQIDWEVLYAFENCPDRCDPKSCVCAGGKGYDLRMVNLNSSILVGQGRAKFLDFSKKHCGCHGGIVKPSGIVKQCMCDDSPVVGTVGSGFPQLNQLECGCLGDTL